MRILIYRKQLLLPTVAFFNIFCLGGCFAIVRYVDGQDLEYWEEFTPEQAAQWVQREPNNSSARAVYGMHLWHQKTYDGAIVQFRYEAMLDPNNSTPPEHVAEVLEEQGNVHTALQEWAIVERLAPKGSR